MGVVSATYSPHLSLSTYTNHRPTILGLYNGLLTFRRVSWLGIELICHGELAPALTVRGRVQTPCPCYRSIIYPPTTVQNPSYMYIGSGNIKLMSWFNQPIPGFSTLFYLWSNSQFSNHTTYRELCSRQSLNFPPSRMAYLPADDVLLGQLKEGVVGESTVTFQWLAKHPR